MAEPLKQFLQDFVNRNYDGKARPLSLRAGLNQNTVGNILESGSGAPETLLKLAPYVGKTPLEMFVLAEWLTGDPEALTAEATEAARLVETAHQEDRVVLLSILRAAADGLRQRRPQPFYRPAAPASLRAADRPAE